MHEVTRIAMADVPAAMAILYRVRGGFYTLTDTDGRRFPLPPHQIAPLHASCGTDTAADYAVVVRARKGPDAKAAIMDAALVAILSGDGKAKIEREHGGRYGVLHPRRWAGERTRGGLALSVSPVAS